MGLFESSTLIAYLAAATVLVLLPGPGTAWIVAQTVAGGVRRGLVAALGLETATTIHALAASFGLSALLATSAVAYEAIKYAGALYLVWLGIKAWREGGATAAPGVGAARMTPLPTVYLRSVATGVLNPKVALFFLAFLPQFVHPERGHAWLQFLALGALLSVLGLCNSTCLAVVTGHIGRSIGVHPQLARWRQRAVGALFVGIGVKLALQSRS